MALENCPECKKEISSQAKNCPHCGYMPKTKKSFFNSWFFWLVLFPLSGLFLLNIIYGGEENEFEPDGNDAIRFAQRFVKKELKAPATAEFPKFKENQEHFTGCCGTFKIKSWVDSENSFGALIRQNYSCTVKYNGSTVKIVDLKFN